ESLTGASEKPPAMPEDIYYLFLVDSTFPHYTCCVAVGFCRQRLLGGPHANSTTDHQSLSP
ncbi:hypothetical protein ACP3WY_00005, partial [Salmonella enterica]|uniref:hypothetical protein n=1 Tax=Salmonella enterica TaxID=28901 RepID=UPI003CE7100E